MSLCCSWKGLAVLPGEFPRVEICERGGKLLSEIYGVRQGNGAKGMFHVEHCEGDPTVSVTGRFHVEHRKERLKGWIESIEYERPGEGHAGVSRELLRAAARESPRSQKAERQPIVAQQIGWSLPPAMRSGSCIHLCARPAASACARKRPARPLPSCRPRAG